MKNSIPVEDYVMENVGTLKWDINQNTVYVSAFLTNLLALPSFEREHSYDDWCALDHPDDAKRNRETLRNYALGQDKFTSIKTRKLCRDGTYRSFTTSGEVTQYDANGAPLIFHGVCLNLTMFIQVSSEFTKTQGVLAEMKRVGQSITEKSNFDHIAYEILLGFSNILKTPACCMVLCGENNKEKIQIIDPLNNTEPCDSAAFKLDRIKYDFFNDVFEAQASKVKSVDDRHFLGVYYALPSLKAMIIVERNYAFSDTILELIHPFIVKTKYIMVDHKMRQTNNESNKLLNFLFEQMPTKVAMFDKNMCYKFASNEWRKYFNFDSSIDSTGKCHYDIIPNISPQLIGMHQKALNGQTTILNKTHIYDYFGKPTWLSGVVSPWYDYNEEIAGIIIYFVDSTEDVELEQKINALNLSNQELERFAHVCSHDLKEPLRSISSFASLLFKESGDELNETSTLYINYILKSIARMDVLIKDILSYAKILDLSDADKKTTVATNHLLHDVLESLNKQIHESNAQIEIDDLPDVVGNKTQLFQLFLNLIGNALKYRTDKQPVIQIFAVDKGDEVEFHVKDNGIGIEEEFHDSIFDFSKRLHSSKDYEGSGIGLSSCKKIVDNHDGTIGVNAEKGMGSDFYFVLPRGVGSDISEEVE